MDCRSGCGACCIAISISSPIPGHPAGKAAGIRCINLTPENRCALWGKPERPEVCNAFMAEEEFCGNSRDEAMKILSALDS